MLNWRIEESGDRQTPLTFYCVAVEIATDDASCMSGDHSCCFCTQTQKHTHTHVEKANYCTLLLEHRVSVDQVAIQVRRKSMNSVGAATTTGDTNEKNSHMDANTLRGHKQHQNDIGNKRI